MGARYDTRSTSRSTAAVEDIILTRTSEPENPLRRRILRPVLVDNVHDKEKAVQICIIHQRRGSVSQEWVDADSFSLANILPGQEIRLRLDSAETYQLYQTLRDLYAIAASGIPQGERRFVVSGSPEHRELLEKADEIISAARKHGDQIWAVIDELEPDVLESLELHRLNAARLRAVQEFRSAMQAKQWDESDWQRFFEENEWIFGHNLVYQFLSRVEPQPYYGGTKLSGTGGQRGDMLMATEARARFTVLVEMKRPDTWLLSGAYRNKVYRLGDDLVGGVAQLQSNCRTWVREGAEQEENREELAGRGIYTYQPRGILVIGDTGQLTNLNQRATFELFRRNLHNPEIITYDELLARAEFLVSVPASQFGHEPT